MQPSSAHGAAENTSMPEVSMDCRVKPGNDEENYGFG